MRRTIGSTCSEGQNKQEDSANIFTTTSNWCEFRNTGGTNQFSQPCTCSSDGHTTDCNIHSLGSADNNHTNYNKKCAQHRHITTADQIRDGACEWSSGRKGKSVCDRKPGPRRVPSNICDSIGYVDQYIR